MDKGAWWATVHGVAKSRTRLSDLKQQLYTQGTLLKIMWQPGLTLLIAYTPIQNKKVKKKNTALPSEQVEAPHLPCGRDN